MSNKFSAKDYNFVAKRIREVYPMRDVIIPAGPNVSQIQRRVLETLAMTFAVKYEEDNERFDPVTFLDACSPNPELYPLSELWNVEDAVALGIEESWREDEN